jgi:predicted DNA-binding transcriptional regulator YafY
MRADRLVATLLYLQSKGRVTAKEVAEELEVSIKTARRDLEALQIAGIPVYSQAGKGGGWSLVGGARTDLSGLTADEARTLFLVAGPSSAVTPAAKAALRKLVQALPETFRAEAEKAASAIVLDPARWGADAPPTAPFLEPLQQAVLQEEQIRLGYADREGAVSERVVHPLGLVSKGTVWYLVGDTEKGMRTFRVWRVQSVESLGVPAVEPPGFDLAEHWQTVVDEMAELRTEQLVQVLVGGTEVDGEQLPGTEVVGWLWGHFGTRMTVGVADAEGRVPVEIGFGDVQRPAMELAGYAHLLEVLDPPEVREDLAGIGARLQARYG